MRILIVGGCGFIGSHVVERLYKEGHKTYIIDNLSTGNLKNVTVPHKFYNLSIESESCEEVFKANKFDAVIDLSSPVVNTNAEASSFELTPSVKGITNLLNFSSKYGVKRFIFASSASVYGNNNLTIKEEAEINPLSPYAVNKYVGEFYTQKWFEIYGLKTISLRISNVFGPRQSIKGEGNVVALFINKALKSSEIDRFGDGTQTRDFIYVEDVVDAIYKALESDYTGVLNISTNTEHSLNELIDTLEEFHPIRKVNYRLNRSGDIKKSKLDNSKAKTELGWDTKYSFRAALEKTYDWYKKNCSLSETVSDTSKAKTKKRTLFKYLPYFENILFMLLIFFLTFSILKVKDPFSSGFADICYMYIIIMSIMYGMKQASLSVIFSCGLYFYLLLNTGYSVVTILYDPTNLPHVLSYIIIGAVCGYAADVYKRNSKIKELKIDTLNNKYKFLETIYNETRNAKEELEEQIIGSENSFVNIYNTTKALDSLEVNDIYFGSIRIIDKLLNTLKSSIYILDRDGKYLRLKAKSSSENFSLPYSVNLDQFREINQAIKSKTVFINRTLNPKLPTMVAPVIINDNVKAIISVYDVKFEKLTLHYENLFKALVDLISNAIGKALKYDEIAARNKYIPNTEILTTKEFKKVLTDKIRNKEISGINFTLLRIKDNNLSYEENFNKLSLSIRDDDLIGLGEGNYIYVILSNTDKIKSEKVLMRISKSGLNAEVMEDLY
ncbi:nucleoside-diphosphate-sugar epimerase [Clostridium acetobutylicum]|uniref:FUSION: Nucleoside-diphosphate-sugar epimerase and GAF domain n=1 Tax=Clostridium acetobutylicum (strain ATCC 824 / DSM 792 / JCM 1419 / IAM 19013 / LMG 5710 / NBRC 13948 / NRRL B-527 / VKM B-1787 / 2291 / W) TaxID=272562 RepID=Q97L35_CLOAB|nr:MULTISPECIES: NAD-dependent epimerase/dehydratase family protein [Clostridium]AAK78707.1 FUSION: Nucleoside-diphosphate-sugar epimerase and GAF domain [Clostridium acetobutylicum ATCC 824]ADZ19781.1 FUSION: Nucleoside-diphosphate-sugar epimerase and GAF domain protein [Clostridium acetobutylicum EA 2018]AEI33781.1 fused nucleoside-diphosphate-sugar epimerase/GAF domain-containing protein [Clostridium acetobutylicum DSM 1731]AWV80426.1 nucleoside-diphosphate sugar epimerase [Clostridium aceto